MAVKPESFPDYVLVRKRLSKTKTVVIFRRNNLSFSCFERVETGYFYHDSFMYRGYNGAIEFTINDVEFDKVFAIDRKDIKIKGSRNHFGVFLRFPDQERLPFKKQGSVECFSFSLVVLGSKPILFSTPTSPNKKKTQMVGEIHNPPTKTVQPISPTVAWNMTHPFQGGRVSPK